MKGCVNGGRPVIGFVYGAWGVLRDELGADAPDYEWCEQTVATWDCAAIAPHPRGGIDFTVIASHLRVWWHHARQRDVPRGTPEPQPEQLSLL